MLDGAVADWIAARDFDEVIDRLPGGGRGAVPRSTTSSSWSPIRRCRRPTRSPRVDDEDLGPLRMQNVWFRLSQHPPGRIRFPWTPARVRTPTTVLADRLGYTPEQVAAAARRTGWVVVTRDT